MALIMRYIDSMQRYMDSYGGKCFSLFTKYKNRLFIFRRLIYNMQNI